MKKEYGAKYIHRIFPNIVRTVIVAAPPDFTFKKYLKSQYTHFFL